MQRLDRRTIVLKGKRSGAFDPNQYYFEESPRTRLWRAGRFWLRSGAPVILIAPRWTSVSLFLDDLATDVALGDPTIKARTLGMHGLKGLTVHQAWAWLATAVAEFCQVSIADGTGSPLWQAVSRRGFKEVLSEILRRAEGGRRRCLMLHGVQHAPVEALQDLLEVFEEHTRTFGNDRVVNLLFAGSFDAPHLALRGARRAELPDYSHEEAIEALVEYHGPEIPEDRLRNVVTVVGGVPAFIDALGEVDPDQFVHFLQDRNALWQHLGPVGDQVRMALDLVAADSTLSNRMERLARVGDLPEEPIDRTLLEAGLVKRNQHRYQATTTIRAPWFIDLVLAP